MRTGDQLLNRLGSSRSISEVSLTMQALTANLLDLLSAIGVDVSAYLCSLCCQLINPSLL